VTSPETVKVKVIMMAEINNVNCRFPKSLGGFRNSE